MCTLKFKYTRRLYRDEPFDFRSGKFDSPGARGQGRCRGSVGWESMCSVEIKICLPTARALIFTSKYVQSLRVFKFGIDHRCERQANRAWCSIPGKRMADGYAGADNYNFVITDGRANDTLKSLLAPCKLIYLRSFKDSTGAAAVIIFLCYNAHPATFAKALADYIIFFQPLKARKSRYAMGLCRPRCEYSAQIAETWNALRLGKSRLAWNTSTKIFSRRHPKCMLAETPEERTIHFLNANLFYALKCIYYSFFH